MDHISSLLYKTWDENMAYWSGFYDPCSLLYKTWDENMGYWSGLYDPCSLLYKTWDENKVYWSDFTMFSSHVLYRREH